MSLRANKLEFELLRVVGASLGFAVLGLAWSALAITATVGA